jgi:hypothetical protein
MRTPTLQETLAYLGAIQSNGGEEKSLPKIGNRRARTVTKYFAGSSADLSANAAATVLPSTKREPGITNFDQGNVLPKGKHLLVTGIRVLFDTTGIDPKEADWAENAPVCWKNGELSVQQDGQGVLFETPGTDVTNFKASTGNDCDFREVVPFLLRPEASFNIYAKLVGTVVASAYKIELRCIELIEGDKA